MRRSARAALTLAMVGLIAEPVQARSDIELASDIVQWAPTLIGAGFVAAHRDKQGLKQLAYSGIAMSTAVWTFKLSIDSSRPDGGSKAFPSGHTATAAWGTGFTQRRYGWQASLLPYLASGFVGWARVHEDRHFTRDVIAGAMIGLVSGWVFTHPFDDNVSVLPLARRGGGGLAFNASW